MSSGRKPLDIGNGIVCASFGHDGSWLSLGTTHPDQGFIELNGLPAFDETWRGDPVATRQYREWMTEERFAFLRWAVPDDVAVEWQVQADAHGCVERLRLGVDRRRRASGPAVSGGALVLRAAGRLDRPPLAEITETDPPLPTGATTRLEADGATLRLIAASLPARAVIEVASEPPVALAWTLGDGGAELAVPVVPGAERVVTVAARFDHAGVARRRATSASEPSAPSSPPRSSRLLIVPSDARQALDRIADRALAYVRECTALLVGPGERAILTDHRVLALCWTRDAYYQALLLLSTGWAADAERVEDHLRWLWLANERPDSRWVRSHHANGRRKDLAFQADEQLYPMLELADCWRARGSLPAGPDWTALVRAAWQVVLDELDPATGLVATSETAADDPAPCPYVLAAQILLWYTATRLRELAAAGVLGLDAAELSALADRTRGSVVERFGGLDGWSYAVDGAGRSVRYHDANDLPVALAPLWGFCGADDPHWQATIDFGLSPSNPGYADGPLGGLGSVHTPGVWPLGILQAWVANSLRGRMAEATAAARQLAAAALDDGMLPEACSPRTGRVVARHWFAWPGAALGALRLLDGRGLLEARLRASDDGGSMTSTPST